MFFLFLCRDAGLHLGAGYRSDPEGGRADSCVFLYRCVLRDVCAWESSYGWCQSSSPNLKG